MADSDTIRFVPVEVAGRPSRSKLLHREAAPTHGRGLAEPVLREATEEERRNRRECRSCLARKAREQAS
jgi:hypothetical protein